MVFIMTYLVFISLIEHKENRFMLPIVPFTFIICGQAIKMAYYRYGKIIIAIIACFWFHESYNYLFVSEGSYDYLAA